MIRTAGAFNPSEEKMYFLASNIAVSKWELHPRILIATNEVRGESGRAQFEQFLDGGACIFLDSGIFALASEHARKHDIALAEAFGQDPTTLDGFEALWQNYTDLATRYGDRLWGYVELDLGGRDAKIATRAKLEAAGLRPIPVYHPLNDGWDYFDYLAERYDRICIGNIVQADIPTRKRIVATICERKRQHPHLWVHLLGYTPNEFLPAFPAANSCDSSSWLTGVRWSASWRETVSMKTFHHFPLEMRYILGDTAGIAGRSKHEQLCAMQAAFLERTWRTIDTRQESL